ncbi:uncharacterized protein [Triticum aestivum]|uniref:uncharacterized protein n=1 Tax=Triticum aestivum TaxID=4565 RepID=UPI001D007994|nr:uncharacterized protein LOC123106312 [Triticum aestivum]
MAAPISWFPVIVAAKPSIFFVAMRPRGEDEREEIIDLARKAGSKKGKELEDALEEGVIHNATGFAVGTVGEAAGGRVKIMVFTVAHLIEHVYHADWQPIDAKTVNKLYEVELYCPHAELDWLARGRRGPRVSFEAWASSIDCVIDCMVLTAYVSDVALRTLTVGAGIQRERRIELCPGPHPELHFSDVLQPCHPCMMLAWPSDLIHLFYVGTQCEVRLAADFSGNAAGYSMSLLEAQIGCTDGASGAPLFNLTGDVIGVLHGKLLDDHSYFVAPQHLLAFLATARDEAAAAAAAEQATAAILAVAAAEQLHAANHAWCDLRRPRSACPRRPRFPRLPPPPPSRRRRRR